MRVLAKIAQGYIKNGVSTFEPITKDSVLYCVSHSLPFILKC